MTFTEFLKNEKSLTRHCELYLLSKTLKKIAGYRMRLFRRYNAVKYHRWYQGIYPIYFDEER